MENKKEFPGLPPLDEPQYPGLLSELEIKLSEDLWKYLSTLSKKEYDEYINNIGSIKDNCIEE